MVPKRAEPSRSDGRMWSRFSCSLKWCVVVKRIDGELRFGGAAWTNAELVAVILATSVLFVRLAEKPRPRVSSINRFKLIVVVPTISDLLFLTSTSDVVFMLVSKRQFPVTSQRTHSLFSSSVPSRADVTEPSSGEAVLITELSLQARRDGGSKLQHREKLNAKCISDSAKSTYQSKINVLTTWLRVRCSTYLDDNRIKIPLDGKTILDFFSSTCSNAILFDECGNDTAEEIDLVPLSISSVVGHRSAIVDLYRSAQAELEPVVDKQLGVMFDGYSRLIDKLKQRGRMNAREGKRHLNFGGYAFLAKKLLSRSPAGKARAWSSSAFAWSYLVLMRNLMSRSDSIDNIMMQHIAWGEDCLVIEEQGHKGDQIGADKYGKHVYANPFQPEVCPTLSLAVLVFTSPPRTAGEQQLFLGSSSTTRFWKTVQVVLNQLSAEDGLVLGAAPNDISAHSVRRGSSTYTLGTVNGPNPVAVFLRMGQSVGKLKDRYIHSAEGADQLCGRVVAGLPLMDERFSVLPPHFDRVILELLDETYWQSIVPGFDNLPLGVRCALPFFLASLIHHESYLRDTLDPQHSLFSARVFVQNTFLDQVRGSTILCCSECEATHLKATGVPPHIAVVAKLAKLGSKTELLHQRMATLNKSVLETMPKEVAREVVNQLRSIPTVREDSHLTLLDTHSRISALERSAVFDTLSTRITALETRNIGRASTLAGESVQRIPVKDNKAIWD